jgi:hypothetical protein
VLQKYCLNSCFSFDRGQKVRDTAFLFGAISDKMPERVFVHITAYFSPIYVHLEI